MYSLFESLESRCHLSASADCLVQPLAESAAPMSARSARPAANPFVGHFIGAIDSPQFGRNNVRLVISSISGARIQGKLYFGTQRARGPAFEFDCKNSKFSLDRLNRSKFSLRVPGPQGPLVLTATITGPRQVKGTFSAHFSDGSPVTGNYTVTKV